MLEVRELAVSKLRPWNDNPRLNDHAVKAVARSIRTFGFNVPILCDKGRTIIAGHARWKAAVKLGMATVPVIVLPMTESQRKAFTVADNKTAEIADWNFPKLRDVLEELQLEEEVPFSAIGFSDEELRRFLGKGGTGGQCSRCAGGGGNRGGRCVETGAASAALR
jgi:site-specific DNA-methyltransferase (adenine-specific)